MTAFDIMRSWEEELGFPPSSDEDLTLDVAGALTCRFFHGTWDEWLEALENDDVAAVCEGRLMFGLPLLC